MDNKLYNKVTNGKVVRLRHLNTHRVLHFENSILNKISDSHDQVTGTIGRDYNDWWKVECECDGLIFSGSVVKLKHLMTGKYLVSDLSFSSPLSHMQGVRCVKYKKSSSEMVELIDPVSDEDKLATDNLWSVLVIDEDTWGTNSKIKLVHINSGALLYSDDFCYESGDQEIDCA